MAGDYSRESYKAAKWFTGLREQQGRVRHEADFNEYEAIVDRHRRVTTMDILGSTAGAAVVPSTTPDGFKVGVAGGNVTLMPGRVYVDGILVECASPAVTQIDASTGEAIGTAVLPIANQPFAFPNIPVALPANGNHIVYLDVWQREVTAYEDETLVDVALGGPDTTTRVQAAWQAKVLANAAVTDCGPSQVWTTLTALPSGRLTTSTTAPTLPLDCVVGELGGYTGLENRLYRVQVHTSGTVGGAPGTQATFVWSRDNASIVARIKSITTVAGKSVVEVESFGVAASDLFRINDVVELLNDEIEFSSHNAGGRVGELARVINVDAANSRVELHTTVAAMSTAATVHPRIRRWDNIAPPGNVFAITTNNGTAIDLEHGIRVTFGPNAAATLRAGDYWTFWARTLTGEVEALAAAPPRGVLHHYARLALVTTAAGAAPVILDCRVPWPNDGCCTEVVHPGESIQAAVNRLPPAGGCVCLKAGDHIITAPVRIDRSDITLHGESEGSIVRRINGAECLIIGRTDGQTIEDLCVHDVEFLASRATQSDEAVVRLVRASHVSIGHVSVGFADNVTDIIAASAFRLEDSREVSIGNGAVEGCSGGVLASGNGGRVRVADMEFRAPAVQSGGINVGMGVFGLLFWDDVVGPCVVDRCVIESFAVGVHFGESAQMSVVRSCEIRRGERALAVAVGFGSSVAVAVTAGGTVPHAAIESIGAGTIIEQNFIELYSDDPMYEGIIASGSSTLVLGNTVECLALGAGPAPPIAVALFGQGLQTRDVSPDNSRVANNEIRGPANGIAVQGSSTSAVFGVTVTDNSLTGAGAGRAFGIDLRNSTGGIVSNNRVATFAFGIEASNGRANTIITNLVQDAQSGISLRNEDAPLVRDNRVVSTSMAVRSEGGVAPTISGNDILQARQFGVLIQGASEALVQSNRLRNVTTGIATMGSREVSILDNDLADVRGTGISVEEAVRSRIERNRLDRCGDAAAGGVNGVAINVAQGGGSTSIIGCMLTDIGLARSRQPVSGDAAGIVVRAESAHIESNETSLSRGIRAGAAAGFNFAALDVMAEEIEALDNILLGVNDVPAARLRRADTITAPPAFTSSARVIFSSNRCSHSGGGRVPAVFLGGTSIAVEGNLIQMTGGGPALHFHSGFAFGGQPMSFATAMGNVTQNAWLIDPSVSVLPANHAQFNHENVPM